VGNGVWVDITVRGAQVDDEWHAIRPKSQASMLPGCRLMVHLNVTDLQWA
jgi:hypothetical protein